MKYAFSLMSLVILALNCLTTPCCASQQITGIEEENLFHHSHPDEHSIDEGSDDSSN